MAKTNLLVTCSSKFINTGFVINTYYKNLILVSYQMKINSLVSFESEKAISENISPQNIKTLCITGSQHGL